VVLGDYHCRRKGFSCQNGGACKSDGSCACPLSHSGFDCSIDTGKSRYNKMKNKIITLSEKFRNPKQKYHPV
jgi:hypothetical protein